MDKKTKTDSKKTKGELFNLLGGTLDSGIEALALALEFHAELCRRKIRALNIVAIIFYLTSMGLGIGLMFNRQIIGLGLLGLLFFIVATRFESQAELLEVDARNSMTQATTLNLILVMMEKEGKKVK